MTPHEQVAAELREMAEDARREANDLLSQAAAYETAAQRVEHAFGSSPAPFTDRGILTIPDDAYQPTPVEEGAQIPPEPVDQPTIHQVPGTVPTPMPGTTTP